MRRALGGGKHPGPRDDISLRGVGGRAKILVDSRERRGLQTFDKLRIGDHGVLEAHRGGDPLSTSSCGVACQARGGPSLKESRLTRTSVVVSISHLRKVVAEPVWGVSFGPHSGDLQSLNFVAFLQSQETGLVVFVRLTARCTSKDGGFACRVRFERSGAGGVGQIAHVVPVTWPDGNGQR